VGTSVSEGWESILAKTFTPSYQMGFLFGKWQPWQHEIGHLPWLYVDNNEWCCVIIVYELFLFIKLLKVIQKPVVLEVSTHIQLFKIWDTSNSCYQFWWCISLKHGEQEHWERTELGSVVREVKEEENTILWTFFQTYNAAITMYMYTTVLSMHLTLLFE